jgi:hypothetical protein
MAPTITGLRSRQPRRFKRGRHFLLKLPVRIIAVGGRMRESAKAASGGETAVRRHKEEAFRRQGHFFPVLPQPKTFPYHPPKTIKILRIIIIYILVG